MKLYKFEWDCDRLGSVEGVFVADPESIKKAMGEGVSFGEILGKHSVIAGMLEEKDLTELDASPIFIDEFQQHFPQGFGYNPLEYLQE